MNSKFSNFITILFACLLVVSSSHAGSVDPNLFNNKVNTPVVQPAAPPPAPNPEITLPPAAVNSAPTTVPNTNVLQASQPVPPPLTPRAVNDPQRAVDNVVSAPNAPAKELREIVNNAPGAKPTREEIVYRANLGRADDIELLIKNGASPDETNVNGVPIICLAASRTDNEGIEVIKTLIKNGANINGLDKRGQNALFYAAKVGNKDVVRYLLENHIKYTTLDASGNNARVVAYQTGQNAIIEILDNFVLEQNNEVRQKYAEINKELIERYNAYNAVILAQAEANRIELEKRKKSRVQELVYEIAFASCAQNYWNFCLENKQQTQFNINELNNNIKSQISRVRDFMNTIIREQQVNKAIVDPVVKGAGDKIVAKLKEFAGNKARADDGVGTVDDMKMRCNLVATSWQVSKEGDISAEKPSASPANTTQIQPASEIKPATSVPPTTAIPPTLPATR